VAEAGDESLSCWIDHPLEDDGYGRRIAYGDLRGKAARHEHVNREIHELQSLAGDDIRVIGAETILKPDGLPVDPTQCRKRILKHLLERPHFQAWVKHPDNRDLRGPRQSGQKLAAAKHRQCGT
jgi:hypothetical protein